MGFRLVVMALSLLVLAGASWAAYTGVGAEDSDVAEQRRGGGVVVVPGSLRSGSPGNRGIGRIK